MPSEKRGRLVFLYRDSTFVRKGIDFRDPGARLRDEVMGELMLMCKTQDIKIFSLADDGEWPLEEDAAAVPGQEIAYSRSIASLFPNANSEGRVHFRVELSTPLSPPQPVTPTTLTTWSPPAPSLGSSTSSKLPKERFPLSLFAEHRRQLNAVLVAKGAAMKGGKVNGKRKRGIDKDGGDYGIASSSVEWGDVANVYASWMQEDTAAFPVKELETDFVEKLVAKLQDERKAFGSAKRTTSVRRLQQSIVTIFGAVATLFDASFTMKMEPHLKNDMVFTSGTPDLLVTRKRCNVVALGCLQENQLRAQAENLLLMDVAIADNEERDLQAAPVCGVVSTFSDWVFYKYDETGIKFLEESLNDNERSIKNDVATIAGIIYNMMEEA